MATPITAVITAVITGPMLILVPILVLIPRFRFWLVVARLVRIPPAKPHRAQTSSSIAWLLARLFVFASATARLFLLRRLY